MVQYVDREEEARRLVDRGVVKAVLRMNKGFGDDLRAGRTAPLQIIVDGTDSNTAGIVLDYVGQIAGRFSETVLQTRFVRATGEPAAPPRVLVETRAWFNENLESRNFYLPGVIVLIVTLVTLMLSSMAIVREKEIGTIEQIMVTPIRQAEFILGKTLPFASIGFADVALVTAIAAYCHREKHRAGDSRILSHGPLARQSPVAFRYIDCLLSCSKIPPW